MQRKESLAELGAVVRKMIRVWTEKWSIANINLTKIRNIADNREKKGKVNLKLK